MHDCIECMRRACVPNERSIYPLCDVCLFHDEKPICVGTNPSIPYWMDGSSQEDINDYLDNLRWSDPGNC